MSSSPSGDFEYDLARITRLDRSNCRVEIGHGETVRDHRLGIELARAKEARHLMPRVVHPASDDTIDGDSLEDDFLRKVELDRLRRNAEHLNPSADAHECER